MNTLFRHFLLLGAIFGLVWQGVAYASPPCAEIHQEQSVAMAGMADCMDTEQQSRDNMPPCDDMAAGCFAMVGCASLVAIDVLQFSVGAPKNAPLTFSWSASAVMVGRNEAPIPDPPSFLG